MKQPTLCRRLKQEVWRVYCKLARPSLVALAARHGTDKLTHGYIDAYADWFASRREQPLNVLEIGVGGYDVPEDGGNSLRMWRDFFPRANIHAIDIADKSPHAETRIKIFRGSQNDPAFLRHVADRIGRLDIVIDDGSHVSEHVITSFNTLFPLLDTRGIYVIEDLHTSYWPQYGGNPSPSADVTSVAFLKRLVDGLHHACIPGRQATDQDRRVSALHVYPGIAFVFKGQNDLALSPGLREQVRLAECRATGDGPK